MKLIFVLVAFAIVAGMYLWHKQVSVASQENVAFDLTLPSAPERKAKNNCELCKKLSQKPFKMGYSYYRVVLASSKMVAISLRIAISIQNTDYI